jgi:oxygen-independent coproporphyrinogen-3 oxidase
MVGETEDNWRRCIEETLRLAPEAVTIYQMEVPYNTTIYQRMRDGEKRIAPVADWETKRRWTDEAFHALEAAGYEIGSAYTAKKDRSVAFRYRDALWTGADMLGVGVSSFGHLGGIHLQNEHHFEPYLARVEAGELPILRAMVLEDEERLVREFILQLKLGRLDTRYFQQKFGVDVFARFGEVLARQQDEGWLTLEPPFIQLSRAGLLQVDRLLHDYFLDRHRNARYA